MRIRKNRPERIPASIERRLRNLREPAPPDVAVAELARDVGRKIEELGPDAGAAAPLDAYIQAHKAKWAVEVKDQHNRLLIEIGKLEAETEALLESRRILCEDQRDVMDDLDAAVAHALERVTDPDSPYHEPVRRSERKGGKP